jgi:hypothetical protein
MVQVVEHLPSKHEALSSNQGRKEGREGGKKEGNSPKYDKDQRVRD